MKSPQTPGEWQEAVDAATGALALDAARWYGLVQGGPTVNVVRCEQIIQEGRRRGINARLDAIERFAKAVVAEQLAALRKRCAEGQYGP